MNVRAFVIIGITSITSVSIPAAAMPKPETSSEGINLKVTPAQNTWEQNDRAEEKKRNGQMEVNSEEISSESRERSETFELKRTEDNCHTSRTNQSAVRRTFEGSCDWDLRF